jgi:hypothetical protein
LSKVKAVLGNNDILKDGSEKAVPTIQTSGINHNIAIK